MSGAVLGAVVVWFGWQVGGLLAVLYRWWRHD